MPRNRRLQYQTATQPVFVPQESITEDKWHSAWSEPVRKPINGTLAIAIIASGLTLAPVLPSPGNATDAVDSPAAFEIIDRRATIYPAYQGPVPIFVEIVTEDKWHQPWSQPVRQKIDSRLSIALGSSGEIYVRPLITQEDKWHQPWSEPVRQKINPRLAIALGSSGEIYVRPLITQEDKWHFPWSEPVRQRRDPRLTIALAASSGNYFNPLPIPTVPPTPGTATDSIDSPVSFEIFDRRGIIYPSYQAPVPIVVAAVIPEDSWHFPWSEPVRKKPGLRTWLQQSLAFYPFPIPNPVVIPPEDSWHYQWSEPVRKKPGLVPWLQQYLAFYPLPLPAVPGTATDAVDSPISFQIVDRRGIIYPSYQGPPPTGIVEIITEDKWHQAWSEPVRLRPKILAYQQQALVTTLRPIEIITEDKWHFPWSQPVQFKRDPRYLATLAASGGVIYPFPLPPIVIVPEDRWHQPWSEPVRYKIGPRLLAALQQFSAMPSRILTGGVITGVLDATEQGDIFYATGLLFNQVVDANVGIIELVPGSALVGVQFDKPTVSANVGIETSIQSAQSGTVISSSFSAIVSVKKA